MRGFLSLEPDAATRARLVTTQNRLRDALTRQGVHFSDRFGVVLFAWPFGRFEELEEAATQIGERTAPPLSLGGLVGLPNGDRPGEVGFPVAGAESLQTEYFGLLRETLDPDPPMAAFVRLARISPPSRKVGAALRSSNLLETGNDLFVPGLIAIWNQTPQGFEVYRTMRVAHGGS